MRHAARLVLRMYAENPAFSVQRYRLTKQVPGLRAYELSVVWRYERALAEYLRGRLGGRPDGILRADVIAAAVDAAHNNALRSWLRSDGRDDAGAAVDHALAYAQVAPRRRARTAPRHLARGRGGRGGAPRDAPVAGAAGGRGRVRGPPTATEGRGDRGARPRPLTAIRGTECLYE